MSTNTVSEAITCEKTPLTPSTVASSLTPSIMEEIFGCVGRCEYVRNVHSGKPINIGSSYPKSYKTSFTTKEEPLKVEEEPEKNPMQLLDDILEGKSNPLFEAALKNVREASKNTPYSWKEFFRMLIMFGAFSFFGREEFSLVFNETKHNIELYMHYIDPSLDDPDLEKKKDEAVVIYNNRKYTSIIYNKNTGLVSKSEILENRTNSTYIWDCRTGKKILTRIATLGNNSNTNKWYEKVVDNVFYMNGYVTAVECIRRFSCGTDIYPVPAEHTYFDTAYPVVFVTKKEEEIARAKAQAEAQIKANAEAKAKRIAEAKSKENANPQGKKQKRKRHENTKEVAA